MTQKLMRDALYGAIGALPHLSGLAHLVTLTADARIQTAAIAASGRLLVNPTWFSTLDADERVFVIAHELLHLALRSHERCSGAEAKLFNVAHDLIINDMLSQALDMPVPANGLDRRGAARSSAERIVIELRRDAAAGRPEPVPGWARRKGETRGSLGTLGHALAAAGLRSAEDRDPGLDCDLLDPDIERTFFPDSAADRTMAARIAAAGEQAVALDLLLQRTRAAFREARAAVGAGPSAMPLAEGLMEVLSGYHTPPWELALQHWLDETAPSGRTYRRCSRRQGARDDVVLAGRAREGWTLTVILDTSGSMVAGDDGGSPIGRALGSLKSFCVAANVGRVRIVQGGMDVESDTIVDARELDRFHIVGGGGSDMQPSMRMVARDVDVDAVIVITDGEIEYPEETMPYAVLWALTDRDIPDAFRPRYGRIVPIDAASSRVASQRL